MRARESKIVLISATVTALILYEIFLNRYGFNKACIAYTWCFAPAIPRAGA